jgi:transposase-like protein
MQDLGFLGFGDYCVTENGDIYSRKSNRYLNLQYNDNGYVCVSLRMQGKTKALKVHRLVGFTYLKDSYFEGAHINHKDGNKANNHYSNLEWVDRVENMRHAHRTGLIVAKPCTLSDDVVECVCRMLQEGVSISQTAKRNNVHRESVYQIIRGGVFKDISSKYDLSKINKQSRVPNESILAAMQALSIGLPVAEVARKTGVNPSSVKRIKYGLLRPYEDKGTLNG